MSSIVKELLDENLSPKEFVKKLADFTSIWPSTILPVWTNDITDAEEKEYDKAKDDKKKDTDLYKKLDKKFHDKCEPEAKAFCSKLQCDGKCIMEDFKYKIQTITKMASGDWMATGVITSITCQCKEVKKDKGGD